MEKASGIPGFAAERILYHAEGLLAVDKAAGLPVHAGTGHERGLVEAVGEWVTSHPGVLDTAPGKPLHPVVLLEKEASGVVLLALSRKAARRVQQVEAPLRKLFLAVVAGPLPAEGRIEGEVRSKVGGRTRRVPASLEYRTLRGDERLSLVEAVPHDRRTHQVRALFAQAGRPLAGDAQYGRPGPARKFRERFGVSGLLLHARRLILPEEVLGHGLVIDAPLPEAFGRVLRAKGWEGAVEELEGSPEDGRRGR